MLGVRTPRGPFTLEFQNKTVIFLVQEVKLVLSRIQIWTLIILGFIQMSKPVQVIFQNICFSLQFVKFTGFKLYFKTQLINLNYKSEHVPDRVGPDQKVSPDRSVKAANEPQPRTRRFCRKTNISWSKRMKSKNIPPSSSVPA